jgi:YVTN family beta-propeller protein
LLVVPTTTTSLQFQDDDLLDIEFIGNATISESIQNNTSLTLDGDHDYGKISVNSTNNITQMTLSTWVKPDYSNGSPEFTILSKENSFSLSINNNISPEKIVKFSIFDGIKWTTVESYQTISEDWTHITASYNDETIKIYVDGKLENFKNISGLSYIVIDNYLDLSTVDTIVSESDVIIGAYVETGNTGTKISKQFSGEIIDVHFFNDILDETQVNELYVSSINEIIYKTTNDEVILEHEPIEIGKTVIWNQEIRLLNETDSISIELPKDAKILNVQTMDELTQNSTNVDISDIDEISISTIDSTLVPLDDQMIQEEKPIKLVTINEYASDFDLEFETPAPYTIENENSTDSEYEKEVTVAHDSTLHYTDVKSYTDIPEELVDDGVEFSLYWMINDTKTDVTNDPRFQVEFVDTDGNGISDQIQWTVPQLSEQTFVIEAIIEVGEKPKDIAVNEVTNRVYVVNEKDDTVSIINGSDNGVITEISVGDKPKAIAVNEVTNRVYVANEHSNDVTVINGSDNSVITEISVGEKPKIIVVNEASNKIYVGNFTEKSITVIDGVTNNLSSISVGDKPSSIAVNEVTNRVYVTNEKDETVSVIDGSDNSIISTIIVGHKPKIAIVNEVTNRVYVVNEQDKTISIINGSDNSVITEISVGDKPKAIAVNEVTNRVYVVNEKDNTVSIIDGSDNSIISLIDVGEKPKIIVVNEATNNIFVANEHPHDGNGTVSVIDGPTNTVIQSIELGDHPKGMAVNEVSKKVYVSNEHDDNVFVIVDDSNEFTVLLQDSISLSDETEISKFVSAPIISRLVANDPNGISGYNDGDTIIVEFSESTNRPSAFTKDDLDNLFTFSQSLGSNYIGQWSSKSILVITIVDSTNATPPQVGVLTFTVNESANLKNEAENSFSSNAISPVLSNNFGTSAGPYVTLLTGADPDGNDAVYGAGDTITVRFSENTNGTSVKTKTDLDKLFDYTQDGSSVVLGTAYHGTWTNSRSLFITIIDSTDASPIPEIGALTFRVKDTEIKLTNSDETSIASTATSAPIIGTFGNKVGPLITSIEAKDPFGRTLNYGNEDTITITFSEPTNTPDPTSETPGLTKSEVDSLFTYFQDSTTPSLGTDYTGKWLTNQIFEIKIVNSLGATPPSVNSFNVKVKESADLKNKSETSLASSSVSSLLTGTFASPAAPTITSLVVSDPDGGDAIYNDDDFFTVQFSESTNATNITTKAELDNLFDYKQGGSDVSIGTSYTGAWLNPSLLKINIADSSGAGAITVGGFAISVNTLAGLKNAAGSSLSSSSTSPTMTGSFGDKPGPGIKSLIADDPDNSDSIFSNGDTITVKFTEPTNALTLFGGTGILTRTQLNNLFIFSQSLSDGYSGKWTTTSTLVVTIDDATIDSSPGFGELIFNVRPSAGLKDESGNSEISSAQSPVLSGSYGTFIEIISVAEGGTVTSTLPSGITASVELPSGKSTTFTMERTDIDETAVDSAVVGIIGTVVNITPEDETVCSEANLCPIEFIFTRDDAALLGIVPADVKINHDKNDNNIFETDEILVTIITQLDENTFKASAFLDSFSKFAVGGVKALALGGLSAGSGPGGNYPYIDSFSMISFGNPSEGF